MIQLEHRQLLKNQSEEQENYFLNPYLFFLLEKEGILAWDYKNHAQYLLNEQHFCVLNSLSSHLPVSDNISEVLQELKEARLIFSTPYESEEEWGWDTLSKIFHIGTQNVYISSNEKNEQNRVQNYLEKSQRFLDVALPFFSERGGLTVELPSPAFNSLDQVPLLTALKNRKTCRNFSGQYLTLEDLSTLLFLSFGLIHGNSWSEPNENNLKIIGMRKSSPASGGLHAEEVYISVYRVLNLPQGIYHYRPQDHKLTMISEGDFEEKIITINYEQDYSRGLSCGFYLTSRLDKIWKKYKHSRALKPALLDLGHVSQTFLLIATALNMQTWMTAAFEEKEVSSILQLESIKESPFLFLGVGYGTGQTIPDNMRQKSEFVR